MDLYERFIPWKGVCLMIHEVASVLVCEYPLVQEGYTANGIVNA